MIDRWRHAALKTEAGWRNCNLRTNFLKIIRGTGVEPWPKPWQNLRSTRETELAEVYPAHVVCAWIGNSEAVAREHYLQVTDDHFAQAATENPTRFPTQPAHASGSKSPHDENPDETTLYVKRTPSKTCDDLRQLAVTRKTGQVGDGGLEPSTSTV